MSDYYGHMTLKDGSHVPLSKEDAEKLWKQAEASQKARADKYPTEQDAINAISEATHRLKELGWSEPCYCPKDGSVFSVIEAGSTGVHDCVYMGSWPDGSWNILSEGDVWPSHPMLFKKKPPSPDTAAPAQEPCKTCGNIGGKGMLKRDGVDFINCPECYPFVDSTGKKGV